MSSVERQTLLGQRAQLLHMHCHSMSSSSARRSRSGLLDDVDDDLSPAMLARARRAQPQFQRSVPRTTCCSRIRAWFKFDAGSIAIFLVFSILLLLFLSILGGLLLRPWFTSGLLLASGSSLLFVLTESSAYGIWHHNRETENRFWICVALVLSSTVVFAPDSPLGGLGHACPICGVVCVIVSAAWVHYYDRLLEREELGRAPHLRRVSSFVLTNSESTKQKLQIVQDALAALDYRFVAAKAINQTQILEAERDIVRTLAECERDELNYILTNVNLALLMYKIKDKDLLTFSKSFSNKAVQHRTRVLELLARERLADLNIPARVVVLDALMNMRLKAHTQAEHLVRDIILGTRGRMLTRMKNACDLKGRVHNFHKLIYRDISDTDVRAEIIAHLAREGEVVRNDGLLPRERRKILSDVDDTLFSSGGHFPAGIDRSYPHHVLYPGVTSFYRELDLGSSSASGEWEEGRQGNLAFLSARPHVYKDKSERKSYQKFEELRLRQQMGLHTVPTLLSGSLDSGFSMFRGLYEPMSFKKFENFTQYAALYPEFSFAFIGDNGQGDVRAGEMMLEALGGQVEAIFIHQVQELHRTPGYTNYASREKWDRMGIHFFRTYIGAALHALRKGMIHPNGLRRIARDAKDYFADLKASGLMPLHMIDQRRAELNRDIEAADEELGRMGLTGLLAGGPIGVIPSECLFHVGSCVETSWGVGRVTRFNERTGIYTVRLSDWTLSHGQPVNAHIHGSDIVWHTKGAVGDAVSTRFGTGILTEIRELNGVHVIKLSEWGHAASLLPLVPSSLAGLPPGTSRTSSAPYAYLQPDDFDVIVAGVGDQVQTPFGVGIVVKYRPPAQIVAGQQEGEEEGGQGHQRITTSEPKPLRMGPVQRQQAAAAAAPETPVALRQRLGERPEDESAAPIGPPTVAGVAAAAAVASVASAAADAGISAVPPTASPVAHESPVDALPPPSPSGPSGASGASVNSNLPPFAESASCSIVSVSHRPGAPSLAPSPRCLTNVGIYVVRLLWHDGGGAVAYLNGRSIRKIVEESNQRRCVVM